MDVFKQLLSGLRNIILKNLDFAYSGLKALQHKIWLQYHGLNHVTAFLLSDSMDHSHKP